MSLFDSRPALIALAALALSSCHDPAPRFAFDGVRAVATGKMAAVYLTIGNSGGADRLLSVEAPDTGMASLHDMAMDGGIMRMRPATDGFALPHGEGVILAPQGKHVMIMANRELEPGSKLTLLLHFERHRTVALAVPVEGPDEAR